MLGNVPTTRYPKSYSSHKRNDNSFCTPKFLINPMDQLPNLA